MISGLAILPYAKLLNTWGRPQCFAVMMGSMTLGVVLMAACQNVETYCAAQVFYYVGYTCVNMTFTIFIADTTSLKNRALVIAFESSPWIITVWVYGYTADSILNTMGFRWGFGIFAIVLPIASAPLFGLFYYYLVQARKAGIIKKEEHNRTFMESVKHWLIEFDVLGLLLIIAGLALFLLAFNLYPGQAQQWKSPLIICFIIIGALLIIGFVIYEKYYAPVTFMPWKLMTDRTVFFTFTMAFFLYMGWYNWDSYFYSYLIVVNNLTIPQATYVTNIYTIGSCVWCLIMGVILKFYGKLKWHAVVWGVPLTILGCGLMIHFRQPDVNIGFICMCQIFIAFGGGTLVICEQMTVMAVSEHQYIPSVLAMENMWIKIGSAIGSTIASAIWQSVFPQKLAEYLPADAQSAITDIYGSITVQSSYAVGTPERDGINQAYASTQRYMLICATCLYGMCWFSVFFWRNIDVRKQKKLKGQLF
jgi:MFS family permease